MSHAPPLNELELYLLLSILRLGEDAYGVSISAELEALRSSRVATSVVYAALDRLAARDLVSSTLGDASPERGGRAKRYFQVTAQGVAALRQTRATLDQLWRHLPAEKGSA